VTYNCLSVRMQRGQKRRSPDEDGGDQPDVIALSSLADQLQRRGVLLAGLAETHLCGTGELTLPGAPWHFSWSGGTAHRAGVALLVHASLWQALCGSVQRVSERLIHARFQLRGGQHLTVLQCYAPTEQHAGGVEADAFYTAVRAAAAAAPRADMLVIMGDFNAQLGSDHSLWPRVMGQYPGDVWRFVPPRPQPRGCRGGRSEHVQQQCGPNMNGLRLLQLAAELQLRIVNTCFQKPAVRLHTWHSPDGRTRRTLDYIMVRQRHWRSVRDSEVLGAVGAGSDHRPLAVTLRVRPPRAARQQRSSAPPRLDDAALDTPAVRLQFAVEVSSRFEPLAGLGDAEELFAAGVRALHEAAAASLSLRPRRRSSAYTPSPAALQAIAHKQRCFAATSQQHASAAEQQQRQQQYRKARRAADAAVQRDKERQARAQAHRMQQLRRRQRLRELWRLMHPAGSGGSQSFAAGVYSADKQTVLRTPAEVLQRFTQHMQQVAACDGGVSPAVAQRLDQLAAEARVVQHEQHLLAQRARGSGPVVQPPAPPPPPEPPPPELLSTPCAQQREASAPGAPGRQPPHGAPRRALLPGSAATVLLPVTPEHVPGEAVSPGAAPGAPAKPCTPPALLASTSGPPPAAPLKPPADAPRHQAPGPVPWPMAAVDAEVLRQQLPTPCIQPPTAGCDAAPSLAEVQEAVKQLRSSAAPGEDGVTARMLKAAPAAADWMHALIGLVWATGETPVAWRRAVLMPLYKGKGDRRDPDNYRGISLLSIVGKVYAIILAKRVAQQVESELLEEQCGFRAGRGLADAVFTLRQVMGQSEQRRLPLHLAFVDLKKAFDSVDRESLWKVLRVYGVHEHLILLVKGLHEGSQAAVRLDGTLGPWFDISRGVKQGCVLAPLLFNVFIDFVARKALHETLQVDPDCGIHFAYTQNGQQWLDAERAGEPMSMRRVAMLLYADDMVLMCRTLAGLQRFLSVLDAVCSSMGMAVNAAKTKVLSMSWAGEQSVFHISGGSIEHVEQFKYLGSHVHSSGSLDTEVTMRIAGAAAAFRRFSHVWCNRHIDVRLKARVYRISVLPALLFAAETWPHLTVSQLRRLDVFQNDCLRTIMGVRRADRHSVASIRASCGVASIEQHALACRLRWLGHLVRMRVDRLPRVCSTLYGRVLASARGNLPARRVGRPCYTWEMQLLTDGLSRLRAPGGEPVTLQHCLSRAMWGRLTSALLHQTPTS